MEAWVGQNNPTQIYSGFIVSFSLKCNLFMIFKRYKYVAQIDFLLFGLMCQRYNDLQTPDLLQPINSN